MTRILLEFGVGLWWVGVVVVGLWVYWRFTSLLGEWLIHILPDTLDDVWVIPIVACAMVWPVLLVLVWAIGHAILGPPDPTHTYLELESKGGLCSNCLLVLDYSWLRL